MFKGFKAVDVVLWCGVWEIARLDVCAGTVAVGWFKGCG